MLRRCLSAYQKSRKLNKGQNQMEKDFNECKKGYLVLDDSVCQEYAGPYETLESAENEDMMYAPKYIVKFEIMKEIKC